MESQALNEAKKSFRETKVEQLRAERETGRPEVDPVEAEPERPPVEAKRRPVLDEDEDTSEEDTGDMDSEALLDSEEPDEDGSPAEDETDEEDDSIDYRAKYHELEKQFSKVTENRKAIEGELGSAHEKVTRMSHDVQDQFEVAKSSAEFFANMADNQLRQLQQVNPAMLPAEQQAQYYQQLNGATQFSQQMRQALHETVRMANESKTKHNQREAEISVSILKARIPGWNNEVYSGLGKVASEFGYKPEEFGEITDHRMILLLHELQKYRSAGETVKKSVKNRKANPPKSRSGKPMARNARGEFVKAQNEFRPNQRGSFARVAEARLKMERQGR